MKAEKKKSEWLLLFCFIRHPSSFILSAMSSAPTIAVINQKGGTGKTTTAVNLAAGLGRAGRRVLLADLDPQGHATYGLGIDFDALDASTPTIENLFGDQRLPLERIAMATREPNLTLLPADIRLARAAAMLHVRNFRESILQKALALGAGGFDYVILDCQPTLDVLAVNALVAADRALIPTPLAGHALRGLSDLLSTIQSIKGDDARFDWRILLTMVSGHGEDRQARAQRILQPLEDRILTTRIHRTEAIEKSQMETDDAPGLIPAILQKQWNRGARDYRALVKEIETLWR
jgi:chromosome partitioning protein